MDRSHRTIQTAVLMLVLVVWWADLEPGFEMKIDAKPH